MNNQLKKAKEFLRTEAKIISEAKGYNQYIGLIIGSKNLIIQVDANSSTKEAALLLVELSKGIELYEEFLDQSPFRKISIEWT